MSSYYSYFIATRPEHGRQGTVIVTVRADCDQVPSPLLMIHY
jgi:hypothetical protein